MRSIYYCPSYIFATTIYVVNHIISIGRYRSLRLRTRYSKVTNYLRPALPATPESPSSSFLSCAVSPAYILRAHVLMTFSASLCYPSQDSMTLSLAAATLVHAPSGSDYTDISMLHLHLFHSACSPISSSAGTHEEVMHAIVKSFHDLTELLKIRKGQERPRMPYHLATLEMMRLVLDRGDVVPD